MIYDKEIDKICAFCQFGEELTEDAILCCRCGPVTPEYSCRKFRYDPLLRKPRLGELPKGSLTSKDFEL